jgi:hypothetical protein
MAKPILPTGSGLVTSAIDEIVRLRPETLVHFNLGSGRWADLPAMWRAQIIVNLARMADEVKSRRLRFATGEPLRALASSEFNTTLPSAPQTALGVVRLQRPAPSVGVAPAGVIKKGAGFTKVAQPAGIPLPPTSPPGNAYPLPIASATYVAASTVYVPEGAGVLSAVSVPLTASAAGAGANVPTFAGQYGTSGLALIQPSAPLFDKTLVGVDCSASGGSSGITDSVLRAASTAYIQGQFGPTDGAILAGCLRQQSVRHIAVFPANDVVTYAQAYVADESWGSAGPPSSTDTPGWVAQVGQSFVTDWQGFGCRVRFGFVTNLGIAVQPSIRLKTTEDLSFTDDIDANVQAVVQSYFNDRPDWYRWRAATLRALVSRADDRILVCDSVTVTDLVTGAPVTEPDNTFGASFAPFLTHLYPTSSSIQSHYLPPN